MTDHDENHAHFDTSPRAMAGRFGELALTRMRAGRDPLHAARLAFSYAEEALAQEHGREARAALAKGDA